jgi:acetyltransferase-like isoleucine patch superfamily enzyme
MKLNAAKLIKSLISDGLLLLITYWPGLFGIKIRAYYYKRKLKYMGKDVIIDTGVIFQNPQFITIQDNCWIDKNVVLMAGLDNSKREKIQKKNTKYPGNPGEIFVGKEVHIGIGGIFSGISGGIYIGNHCTFSADCKVYSFTSHYRSKINPSNQKIYFGSMSKHSCQCIIEGPIYLKENVGVALNSVILPGVTIEKNSFIAINSIVNKDVESNGIFKGYPGKVIRKRFTTE